jgi:hypothetical protein
VSFQVGDVLAVEVDQRHVECFEDGHQPLHRVHEYRENHGAVMPSDPIPKRRQGVTGVASSMSPRAPWTRREAAGRDLAV